MSARGGAVRAAATLAVVAAFLWATYYYFVLRLSSAARPPSVLAYPFLVAGAVFVALTIPRGEWRAFLRIWRSPVAYLRAGLLAAMQVSVLAGTYTAGPIDTSLLSLLGDVALTPLLLMALYAEGRGRLRSPVFVLGLVASFAGATLTIVGGSAAAPLQGWAWLVAPAVPLSVAFYFLLTAQANRGAPAYAVVGQASLAAGLISVALSPWLPGGVAGLGVASPGDAALLVGLGVTSFFLAPWFYFAAVERAGLLLPALLMATIPLFTLLVEFLGFGQGATLIALLGVPIAVIGGFLASQGSHPGWTPTYRATAEGDAK